MKSATKRRNDARKKDNKKKQTKKGSSIRAAISIGGKWCSQIIFNILHIFRHHYLLLSTKKKHFFFAMPLHCTYTSFSLENWRQRWNWRWQNSNIINIDWWKLYVDGLCIQQSIIFSFWIVSGLTTIAISFSVHYVVIICWIILKMFNMHINTLFHPVQWKRIVRCNISLLSLHISVFF